MSFTHTNLFILILTDVCFAVFHSNRVPWIVIIVCEFTFGSLMLISRMYLARENKKRDLQRLQEKNISEDIYVLDVDGDGTESQKVVDKVCCACCNAVRYSG